MEKLHYLLFLLKKKYKKLHSLKNKKKLLKNCIKAYLNILFLLKIPNW